MSRNIEKQEEHQREEANERAHPHEHHLHEQHLHEQHLHEQHLHEQHLHEQHLHHSAATIILWTAAVVLVLLGIFGTIGVLTTSSTPGNSEGGGLLGGAIVIGLGALCGWLAWHRRPVAGTAGGRLASHPFTASGPAQRRSYRGRHHIKDPRKQAAIFGILFIASAVAVPFVIGDSERSAYTQHHGVSTTATVRSVDNDTSCNRGSCSTTFATTATLDPAVGSQTETTIHGQGYFPDGAPGSRLTVLVDPQDPGYAEIPGDKLNSSGGWLIFVGLALVCGVVTGLAVQRSLRMYPGLLPSRHVSASRGVKLV